MELTEFQRGLESLRPADADYLIVAVGVRGPNIDCDEGNAVATVRMGNDEATSEALHLRDAIALARAAILRDRKAKADAADAAKKKASAA